MDSNAPGQLLGYILQFPRALFHLLRCEPLDKICLEVLGDVAIISEDGNFTVEEDKSSQVSNPVTDRSIDLWKTFYNWVNLISAGSLEIDRTKFILYANKIGRSGIVNQFNSANDLSTAKQAYSNAQILLLNLKSTHPVWPYLNFILNQNQEVFLKIIVNFELQVGSGGGFEAIKNEIKKKFIPDSQIDFILYNLSGWLQKIVIDRLANKQSAIISWEEFSFQFRTLFDRAKRRELIDFALESGPSAGELKSLLKERPTYIKQLDEINADDEEIQQAVCDFIKAKVNRFNWIEKEIIDETTALDFEMKLLDFWKAQKRKIAITNKDSDNFEKGMLLYLECRTRQEMIKDQNPPAATIPGTFHVLADEAEIGWHPDWENSFKKTYRDHGRIT